ncbi:hypothetical protein E2C01_003685 [Portunus trituberculatus]|uniref:Uncharacterized protein n=1 Tax=Portunus trituberculatus TaxID=210409 RepID=A0A5B7CMR9_PORTR|nr:hypothetical protein [Portunus trituberculatus]
MPPLLLQLCRPRLSSSHPCSVQPSNTRLNQYSQLFIFFFFFFFNLWNSLPASVILSSYNLTSFKRGVSSHLFLSFD